MNIYGGVALNSLIDEISIEVQEMIDLGITIITAGGYPVGHEPVQPVEEYETLSRWKQTQDRRFYTDKAAQERMGELEREFGTVDIPRDYDQLPMMGQPQ